MNNGVPFKKWSKGLLGMASKSLVAVVLTAGIFSSSNAQAVDSFFDVFVALSESGQVVMQTVDSGEFPFPPPPLNFPDIETAAPGNQTIDIEIVALSLVSSSRIPMNIGTPDPSGSFQVDSFFDITYQVNATDSTGTTTNTTDSFFDIAVSMLVTPEAPVILPTGEESRGFATEILSVSLSESNPVPLSGAPDFDLAIQLTEGQATKSDGHVTVLKSPAGGGGNTYAVDSFFDVFVEISVDGGPLVSSLENSQLRFQSQNVTTIVPEPSSLLLGALASVGLLLRRKNKQT